MKISDWKQDLPESVIKIMLRMEALNKQKKEITQEYNDMRTQLMDEFDEHEVDRFLFDDGEDKLLVADRYLTTRVSYDPLVLRKKVSRDIFKKVAKVVIDTKKVEAAYEAGLIKPEQVKEAAEVKQSVNVSVKRVKR